MTLLIGWAEEDATPQGVVDLFGQYYHRASEGIHSRCCRSPHSRANTRCGRGAPKARSYRLLRSWASASCRCRPLGKGFLTGKIDENATFDKADFRSVLPRFTPEALKANQALVDLLGAVAQRKSATPAQIALAWLLAQKPWIVPIPGTTKLYRLDENIDALSVELTPDDLKEIESAASGITVQGLDTPKTWSG